MSMIHRIPHPDEDGPWLTEAETQAVLASARQQTDPEILGDALDDATQPEALPETLQDGPIRPEHQAAWDACLPECPAGEVPAYRALDAKLKEQTGSMGGPGPRRLAWRTLQARAKTQLSPSEAVTQAQATLADCTRTVEARIAVKRQVEAAKQVAVGAVLQLKEKAQRGDVEAAGQIQAAEKDLRDLNDQLDAMPAMLDEAAAAETTAVHHLRTAEHQQHLAACVERQASRAALVAPGSRLMAAAAELEDALGENATEAEAHRLEHARAGLPWDVAGARAVSKLLFQRFRLWMPLPLQMHQSAQRSLDAWAASPMEDLVAADPTCQPRTIEALEALVGTGTVLVRWHGQRDGSRRDPTGDPRLPSLVAAGVTRPVMTQARFQRGQPVEFTQAEYALLLEHYGASVEVVEPPTWS